MDAVRVTVLISFATVAAVAHGQTAIEDAMNYRLPASVAPTFQAVQLDIDADQHDYSGRVRIDLTLDTHIRSFQLHAEDLAVTRLSLRGAGGNMATTYTHESPHLTIAPAWPLAPGDYTLTIDFTNAFGTRAVGLYRAEVGGRGYVFTQFEADDARLAFPCFDEPAFKFPWQLEITVPAGHSAVTNTPVERESVIDGRRTLRFQRTQPLPSYLIAIAAGELESVPIEGMSTPGSVITVRGQSHLAGLAAEMAPPILAALEEYFGDPYPYEKLDLVAVPEFWPGAMEHPGAVTFDAAVLLVDPNVAALAQKRSLARVIAHELAHMWFGDVVTMEWWDDLWLNEAFADWLGDAIAHRVFPAYNLEVTEMQASLRVMGSDARPSAQPIRVPVTGTDQLLQNIGIQYNKGKAVLGMFEQWIGHQSFRSGVLGYIDAHRWKNATADDLWRALASASEHDVPGAMATFVEQPGLPLVTVEEVAGSRVALGQRRFTNYGVDAEPQLWRIPVGLKYADQHSVHTRTVLLTAERQVFDLDTDGGIEWIYPNADQRGYYRWRVDGDALVGLAARSREILGERERVGFLSNLAALLDAGFIQGDEYLRAIAPFGDDPKPLVVDAMISRLDKTWETFIDGESAKSFASYVTTALTPALERFGAAPRTGEDDAVAILRPALLSALAEYGGDDATYEYAHGLATRYMRDSASIDPSLSQIALTIAALRGDEALFETYCRHYENASVPAERTRYLRALGGFRDPELVDRVLAYVIDGPLAPDELFTVPRQMRGIPALQDQVFSWFREHYETIAARTPPVYLSLLPMFAAGCSRDRLETARDFFALPEHQAPGTEAQLAKVTDEVSDCAGLRERQGERVASYLNGVSVSQ